MKRWLALIALPVAAIAYTLRPSAPTEERAAASSQDFGVEFVLYDKTHWIDALTPGQRQKYIKDGMLKQEVIDNTDQPGDIIDVFKWPFLEDRFKRADPNDKTYANFRLVIVKGITLEQAKQYAQCNEFGRHKFSIPNGNGNKITTIDTVQQVTLRAN